MSDEHKSYLKKLKKTKLFIAFFRIFIFLFILIIWEIFERHNIINGFLSSSPTKIFLTIIDLFNNNNLLLHIGTTFFEVVISFIISIVIGLLLSFILWRFEIIEKIIDPYLTIINSLPKVSLGPLIIIIIGANTKSIIVMALLISTFTTVINFYTSFINTDNYKIILLKSFKASKLQIFNKLIIKNNLKNIISSLKVNISLTLIGIKSPVRNFFILF